MPGDHNGNQQKPWQVWIQNVWFSFVYFTSLSFL